MSRTADTGTDRYSMAELMAVEMSRNLAQVDGMVGGVGVAASIPMAALRLATLTVAPNLYWFCGSSGGMNPTFDRLPLTSADPRAFVGAEARKSMFDVVDMGMTGKWGFGFHGGMQIDKFGNCNMIGIGPYENMKVRGPGSVGLTWAGAMMYAFLFTWHHNARVFVDKVDYVSGPGFLDGGGSRWNHLRRSSKGPALVYSPICVMDFDEATHRMRLRSVNPGYTAEDVRANTGFELIVPARVPATREPTEQELLILRTEIDRDRLLKDFRLTVG